jgi:hypothetical protein
VTDYGTAVCSVSGVSTSGNLECASEGVSCMAVYDDGVSKACDEIAVFSNGVVLCNWN